MNVLITFFKEFEAEDAANNRCRGCMNFCYAKFPGVKGE